MEKQQLHNIDLSMVPSKIGCYLWKDENNQVIYVGKANNLKSRMKQYFLPQTNSKTMLLARKIRSFDYILAPTTHDALLLELSLINEHSPQYNIKLKEEKRYPYIKLETHPRLKLSLAKKYVKKKGVKYYGPFPDEFGPFSIIKSLKQIYPINECTNKKKNSPCINYQLGKCMGYCKGEVTEEKVKNLTSLITKFFQLDTSFVLNELNRKLEETTELQRYEEAIKIKKQIDRIKLYKENQIIYFNENVNYDFINYHINDGLIVISIIYIRYGKMVDSSTWMHRIYSFNVEDFFSQWVNIYYLNHLSPNKIFLPFEIEAITNIEEKIVVPLKGRKKKLLDLSMKTALDKYEADALIFELSLQRKDKSHEDFKKVINISKTELIELIDISNFGGKDQVGTVVQFRNGEPNKKYYRKYNLENGQNDYKNIYDVTYRHFRQKLLQNIPLCDVLIVDGKYQINNSIKALIDLGIKDKIKVIGLVKNKKHDTSAIILENNEIIEISDKNPLYLFLGFMQDEIHRFTLSYHKQKRRKRYTK